MRISSYPPFIVFFDTLAIIIFFLLIRQESGVQIEIQGDELPPGFSIIQANTTERDRQHSDDVEILLSCSELYQCPEAQPGGAQVKLPLSLVNEIGQLKLLSASMKCGEIDVIVSPDGHINRQMTANRNQCIRGIAKIKEWVGKES